MERLGFCREWIRLVMVCVTKVKYKVLWDNELMAPIMPGRGLRQGDLPSPYLLIGVEGLSELLRKNEQKGLLHGCKIATGAPILTHLFFADDSLLFCRATLEECKHLQKLLEVYRVVSTQAVNFNKSALYFSKNTNAEVKRQICNELKIQEADHQFLYLGMPVGIGRKKKEVF